ncbi:MAG: DUF1028 domain-containing protein [Planctomycetota bacterium]
MKKLLAVLLATALLALPAGATWSIVVVNPRTGEVAVATATCLANFPLWRWVPLVVVGKGAGAAQSTIDGGARNRLIMWHDLQAGWTPKEILQDLIENGLTPATRQYGVAAFAGPAVTFSGAQCGQGLGNITGRAGDCFYAIQGNLLTGAEPVLAAEAALVGTDGDLGQRIMAAMEAARAMGGDGRCSCDPADPTGCGAPPPDFEKSAHCGLVYIARIGDIDGDCTSSYGCATGEYYLKISFSGLVEDPDPVFVLQGMYDTWRAGLAGRPDHVLSTASTPAQFLPADGTTSATVSVRLVDVEGVPLAAGGATVAASVAATAAASVGETSDHGDGSYSFPLIAGRKPGPVEVEITAEDGVVKATLYPFLAVEVKEATPLFAGRDHVSAEETSEVALTLNVPEAAGRPYLILASAAGTEPGFLWGEVLVPLNPDAVTWRSLVGRNGDVFRNTYGVLDGAGHAEAAFHAPAGLLTSLAGGRLDWAALILDPDAPVTNPVGFDVRPGP